MEVRLKETSSATRAMIKDHAFRFLQEQMVLKYALIYQKQKDLEGFRESAKKEELTRVSFS